MAPLALITSCFATLVTHLPIILLITSPTPIGRTSPLPLSSGIRRLATIGSMVSGSTNSVHSLLVSVAIDSHRLILDLLKDLHAKILLKPLASRAFSSQCRFSHKLSVNSLSQLIVVIIIIIIIIALVLALFRSKGDTNIDSLNSLGNPTFYYPT